MRKYEIMFIVDPHVSEEEIDKISSQIGEVITDGGGDIENVEKMGLRTLAYEIEKKREGFYVLLTARANGEIIKEAERRFRVMDQVLRYLTVRIDEGQKKLDKVRADRDRKDSRRAAKRSSSAAEQSPAS